LGLPVFMQQAQLPKKLTLAEYHAWMMQRPRFVGRYVGCAGAACSGECSAAVQSQAEH
jgi:hypothetical protein